MSKPITLPILVTALLAVPALGCDDATTSDAGTGRLQIALTDAPAAGIQAAFVVVSEVYLQGDDGRVVLRDEPITIDLLTLANSTMTLVDEPVPTGTYDQLRLVIDAAWIEVEGEGGLAYYATAGHDIDGADAVAELRTPSWSSSGLKVKLPDDRLVVDGSQMILVVDFDVAESFQTETGSGAWVMRPVVQANALEMTTAIAVTAHVGVDVTTAVGLNIELYDREGFFEGSLPLVDDDDDGYASATFVYVDPSEGPFTARVVTADGLVVTTLPADPTVVGESGMTVDLELDLVTVVME